MKLVEVICYVIVWCDIFECFLIDGLIEFDFNIVEWVIRF